MVEMARQPEEQPENELAKLYDKLVVISERFAAMAKYIDYKNWVVFNSLRDEGKELSEIAEIMEMPISLLEQAEHPRRCYFKWDGDEEKLRDCVEGKIDP